MNILTLSVRQKFFDQIVSGEKKQEFREIRHNNTARYCKVDARGDIVAKDDVLQPRKYDAIKFLTGKHEGKRPFILVKIKEASIELFVDDEGEYITYEHEGEEYIAAQIVYDLGEVIENV